MRLMQDRYGTLSMRESLISNPRLSFEKLEAATRRTMTPYPLIQSALFLVLFMVAVVSVGLGGMMAFAQNEQRAVQALPILLINCVLITVLAVYLVMRVWRTLFSSKDGDPASQLHRRFLMIFSLAAILPAVVVGTFFGSLMVRDINDLLSTNVRQVMTESRVVSNAYLNRELELFQPDVRTLKATVNQSSTLLEERITFTDFLISQAVFWEFPAVYVINSEGRILAKAESPSAPMYQAPSRELWDIAMDEKGPLTVGNRSEIDFLQALVRLDKYEDAYLYTGRYLEEGILSTLENMDALEEIVTRVTTGRGKIEKIFLLTYIQAALLILIAAVWFGVVLASRIVTPLGQLVMAAEKVRAGDLTTRVNVTGVWDEISDLAGAFNRMTRQLGTQRDDLILEHDISEQRRQFSEAVLSGVSAGVIGLSRKGRITLMNSSAETLLGKLSSDVVGKPIADVIAPFEAAYLAALEAVDRSVENQVSVETSYGERNFDLRVSPYQGDQRDTGWVMTFDDMTRLVSAQRHTAWREVARRIAHEIKNPLTPIQLSAERLERKYAGEVTSDPDTFKSLTGTITRQVETLGAMVDAFSEFARMPAPELKTVDVHLLMETAVFVQRVAFPDIRFTITDETQDGVQVLCDERLMGQAMMNLLKNAGESVTSRVDADGLEDPDGRIDILMDQHEGLLIITVVDNGRGWPETQKDRLFEPYVTTRETGTGLGLAIVKRVIEDHGGHLSLHDRVDNKRGAYVKFSLPMLSIDTTVDLKPGTELKNKSRNNNELVD